MRNTQRKSVVKNDRLVEIYRTAAEIILRKGYDATSVNDIANALGMTKAGLYHYIHGKKELLFDIMNYSMEELDREVVIPARKIPDARARLQFMIVSHAQLVTRGQGAVTILVDEITALTPAQNRKITRHKRLYFDFLRDTLEQLKTEGKLLNVNTTVATFTLLGMILWPSRWFRQDGSLTSEQVAQEILKMAVQALLRPDSIREQRGFKLVQS